MTVDKPLPPVNAETVPFWRACAEGRLVIQRCGRCRAHQFYPRLVCSACGSSEIDWVDASGGGRLKSWTVIRRAVSQAFEADVPYVVALVQLDEGPTMMTNLVSCDPKSLVMDQRVRVTFESRGADLCVPQFQPEKGKNPPKGRKP